MSISQSQEIFVPKYLDLIQIWEDHEREHWIPSEADMTKDVEQWKTGVVIPSQKANIKMILRQFTQSDKNVCDNYVTKLLPIFAAPEARMMLLSFAARETTHILGYKRLNDTLGYDSEEFMSEFLQYKEMKDRHEYMIESVPLDSARNIADYLVRQVLMEGVSLFAPFCQLLSFSQAGLLPGMVSVNQWSIVEEGMHANGLTALLHHHLSEHPRVVNDAFKKAAYETARQIVTLEDASTDLTFSAGESGVVTADQVKAYVRYVCDYRMVKMGFKPQFGVTKQPIEWMDYITGNTFGNFFETTVLQYSKDSMTGEFEYDV